MSFICYKKVSAIGVINTQMVITFKSEIILYVVFKLIISHMKCFRIQYLKRKKNAASFFYEGCNGRGVNACRAITVES